jgi:hypothetical protein
MFTNTSMATVMSHQGQFKGSGSVIYSIIVHDIKSKVTLPGGTFSNVVAQAEQQICSGSTTYKYRFYFAPGKGIVAMQFFDDNWKAGSIPLIVLTKTCLGVKTQYACP